MKYAEIEKKDKTALVEQLLDSRKELFNLRFQQATGQLENTARFRVVRRDIARIKTALRAKTESED
ncbi:50S ribosomal protein L29 [Marinivivus vitaminiproducens]|uniref:50S ribosomal protein L29 n=1 Tax=Marinivivus vitaminiproducens TaxID=3035935 RepID=UPI0027A2E562|nr:50S ribosomal protein L29 [Geminicoccaceae bacterium SCSIO 64248]